MTVVGLSQQDAERWLSRPRFSIYLLAVGGDLGRAIHLYEWNARLTSALLRDVGHLEVLVRNRYDPALVNLYPTWTEVRSPIWKLENGLTQARALQRQSNKKSLQALQAARRKANTHGHVVANLTFGFWASLTRSERESTIWTPMLSSVFPGLTRGHVHDVMEKLNIFRNRLAHWEPVFSATTGLMRQIQLMDDMFTALDPDVRRWVAVHSDVPSSLAAMPEPLLAASTGAYLGVPQAVVVRSALASRVVAWIGRHVHR